MRGELHSDDQHDAAGAVHVRHSVLPGPSRAGVRACRDGLQHGLGRHARQPPDDLRLRRRRASFPAGPHVPSRRRAITPLGPFTLDARQSRTATRVSAVIELIGSSDAVPTMDRCSYARIYVV